jgi:hypothetical protein
VINGILSAAGEAMPGYLGAGDPTALLVSNSSLDSHRTLRQLVHDEGATTDFLVSNPSLDLMYYDSPVGGHSGLLGAVSSPPVHDWLFAHTTAPAAPEPDALLLVGPAVFFAISRRFCGTKSCA